MALSGSNLIPTCLSPLRSIKSADKRRANLAEVLKLAEENYRIGKANLSYNNARLILLKAILDAVKRGSQFKGLNYDVSAHLDRGCERFFGVLRLGSTIKPQNYYLYYFQILFV